LANWAGRERDAPAGKRRAAPDLKVPGLNTAAVLLWRRSQAVQLPLVQAFPVLEVIVQVLHKIGEICESLRDNKRKSLISDLTKSSNHHHFH